MLMAMYMSGPAGVYLPCVGLLREVLGRNFGLQLLTAASDL